MWTKAVCEDCFQIYCEKTIILHQHIRELCVKPQLLFCSGHQGGSITMTIYDISYCKRTNQGANFKTH